MDLIFPHHENEIAQSKAAGRRVRPVLAAQRLGHHGRGEDEQVAGQRRCRYRPMLQRVRPAELRYYLGSAHYRSMLEYSEMRWRRRSRPTPDRGVPAPRSHSGWRRLFDTPQQPLRIAQLVAALFLDARQRFGMRRDIARKDRGPRKPGACRPARRLVGESGPIRHSKKNAAPAPRRAGVIARKFMSLTISATPLLRSDGLRPWSATGWRAGESAGCSRAD